MRKFVFSALVLVALLVAVVAPASAQAPGPGNWVTGFTMQNLGSGPAQVHIDFVNSSGATVATWNTPSDKPIPVNGSQFLYSANIAGLVDGSEVAATISSDQPLAAVANLGSSGPKTEGAYSGVDTAGVAPTLYAPGVYKNYYNNVSNIRVQNTGGSKTCVRVSFRAIGQAGDLTSQVFDVPAGAAHTFTQADNGQLPNNFIGSARIESVGAGTPNCGGDTAGGQALAAIINISVTPGPSAGNPTNRYLFGSYNAVLSGAPRAYVPVLANGYYNNISSLTVLNLNGSAQWVRVSYGDGKVKEKQVPGNSSQLWYTPNEGPAKGWFGSARIECISGPGGSVVDTCSIVTTVNQINTTGGFAAYNGFTGGTATVSLPIVNRRYATQFGGYTTSVTCQNISDVTTNISLALTGGNSVPTLTNIGKNGSAFWYLNKAEYTGVANGFNGSATATVSNPSARIVCIGQQNGETPPTAGDWLTTYNGINR